MSNTSALFNRVVFKFKGYLNSVSTDDPFRIPSLYVPMSSFQLQVPKYKPFGKGVILNKLS
jgi:hypothetical protein